MAKVLYFGPLADMLGKESETISVAAHPNIAALLAELRERGGDWARYLSEDKLQITVNRQFTDANSAVREEDEIALISIAGKV